VTVFKSDVQSVRHSRRYSYTDADTTGLTALSMIRWSKRCHSWISRSFKWSTSRIWWRYTRFCKCPSRSGLFGGQYCCPMKSGVSADSSATVLRALWAGALSCWNAKKGPAIERMENDITAVANSGNMNHLSSQQVNKNKLGTSERWDTNGHH